MIAQGETAEDGPILDRGPGRGREPLRTCIVTREAKASAGLIRFVLGPDQQRRLHATRATVSAVTGRAPNFLISFAQPGYASSRVIWPY